jgi:hypothetical protein
MTKPKVFALWCLLSLSQAALADGGRLSLHERAGPFTVTLFTTPDPLTQGSADFSVAVERPGDLGLDQGLVEDAKVTLILTPLDATRPGSGQRLVLAATHAAASSAFLQAANFTLPAPGLWNITIVVQQGRDLGECAGVIDVLPYRVATDGIAWQIALVPLAMLLFAVHQARKRRHRQPR